MSNEDLSELIDVHDFLLASGPYRRAQIDEAAERHGKQKVLDAALAIIATGPPARQIAALYAVSRIGAYDADCIDVLVSAATELVASKDAVMREAVADSLSQARDDSRTTLPLLLLADDLDVHVRRAALCSLSLPSDDEPESGCEVKALLLRRFTDEDAVVRDWAVFGLGCQREFDSPALRLALRDRLDDLGEETAMEAAIALGLRGDVSALPYLIDILNQEYVEERAIEAAQVLGDPSLKPALVSLRHDGWPENEGERLVLEAAIAACS
jgi:HEAT repeat protein